MQAELSSLPNTSSYGWVSLEGWEAAQSAKKELFDEMLQVF